MSCISGLISLIDSRYPDPNFDLRSVFKASPLSPAGTRAAFKKAVGQTPLDYLISKRIARACNLLDMYKAGDMSIKETALRSGFSDPLYFSRLFRKTVGLSPSEYRAYGQKKNI